jgi:hypothetical protein
VPKTKFLSPDKRRTTLALSEYSVPLLSCVVVAVM